MPQALAFALFNAGVPLAVVNAVAGVGVAGAILHTTVAIAASSALSIGASALLRPSGPTPSSGQQETQQPIPPRMWHYGRVRVAGPLWFFDVNGRQLFRGVILSAREISSVEAEWIDDNIVDKDAGTGVVTSGGPAGNAGLVTLRNHLGTDAQTVDAVLDATFTDVTSNHRLRGVAHTVAIYNQGGNPDDFQWAYPNGILAYVALIESALVYDPRLDSSVGGSGSHDHDDPSTWEYSNNPALCILDYLRHSDGYNRRIESIDLPSFMAFADLCEEQVDLKASGLTIDRYRIATTIYLTEARKEVLQRLLASCDAELYPTSTGKWAIRGGEWVEPTVTLDASQGHIIEARFSNGVDALARYNELTIRYMSPAHLFVEVEGDPWRNEDDISETGVTESRPLDLLQVPSHSQARRLAKIRMAYDNPRWTGEIKTNFYGLDAIGERCINIVWDELDIDEPFWIEDLSVLSDGTGCIIRIRSADETAYDWDADTEEGIEPEVPPDISGESGIDEIDTGD